MENIIRQIDHRIAMKRVALMEKDLNQMDQVIHSCAQQVKKVDETYNIILLKDKPVGSGIKLARYIKNERIS